MKKEDKQRADRVIEVFNNTGLNQRQFSELIGVSQQLVSAVVNYTKKPNETILLAIIDHIEGIDPMWLFTGNENYKTNYVPLKREESPIENHIKNMVRDEFIELSKDIIQKLANIEDAINNTN
ncbi:helix-turn-helix domain-containing protein [Polaribacter sp. R77954]|uniref:helix-turn-helix domain-containing protein n=1 Tax=Polaribacter sp. R77954 TaxID=3093870 RepID=UPI0037C9B400